jgi:ABC-type glycerol-3-phosphate transport system permease component
MTGASGIAAQPSAIAPASSVRRVARSTRIAAVWLIFSTLALSTLYPVVFVTMTAFRTNDDYMSNPAGIPKAVTFDNLTNAFVNAQMGRFALNSLIVVVAAVILLTIVSCLAAYALTHFDFPLRNAILVAIVGMLALPVAVLMIPIFKVVLNLGLLNARLGLILVYTAILLPFNIYLLSSYMRSIPRELHYAAQIDGAGALRSLWSVVLPLVRPGLFTVITLDFLALWNDLLFSLLILQEEDSRTIMVGIAQFQGYMSVDIGAVSAGLLLSMIPPLLIFLFFQRNLSRDVTGGAVK